MSFLAFGALETKNSTLVFNLEMSEEFWIWYFCL